MILFQVIKKYQTGDPDDENERIKGFERFAESYIRVVVTLLYIFIYKLLACRLNFQ